ncbi:MAG: hypothetical protein IPL39_13080 [Opitutaceae bacterium]|nr:hypothetical protein [Opitutaceae bacterium]
MKSPSFPLIAALGVGLLSGVLRAAPQLHDLRVAPVAGQPAQMQLTYGPIVPDWIYTPQASSDLGNWAPLTSFSQNDANGVRTITDQAAGGARRFYRLVGEPPARMIGPSLDQFRNPNPKRVFYVDGRSGLDTNAGTSPATPWKTLFRLHSAGLRAGDVVRLARGCVWRRESFFLDAGAHGTAEEPIVIEAYGTGEPPTIADPRAHWDATRPWPGVAFGRDPSVAEPSSYIHLLDVRIADFESTGVLMSPESHHLVVAGVEVRRCGAGVGIVGAHQKVIGCYVHDGVMAVDTGNGSTDWGANGVTVVGRDIEIAWNRFVNCSAPSKAFGTDGGVVEFFGYVRTAADPSGWNNVSDDIRVHHNVAENCWGMLEGAGKVTNLLVANNLYFGGSNSLFVLHLDTVIADAAYDLRVENNTFVSGEPENVGTIFSLYSAKRGDLHPGTTLTVRNNVMVVRGQVIYDAAAIGTAFVHDHNLISLAPGATLGSGVDQWVVGATERLADPRFMDALGEDYRLAPGSPAIDAGVAATFPADLRGTPVPTGAAPDLGAYEAK